MPDQTSRSAIAFLQAAIAYYQSLDVVVKSVMTANGSRYTSRVFREACAMLDIRHIRTRSTTPGTNGKVEHFLRTDRIQGVGLCERLSDILLHTATEP